MGKLKKVLSLIEKLSEDEYKTLIAKLDEDEEETPTPSEEAPEAPLDPETEEDKETPATDPETSADDDGAPVEEEPKDDDSKLRTMIKELVDEAVKTALSESNRKSEEPDDNTKKELSKLENIYNS